MAIDKKTGTDGMPFGCMGTVIAGSIVFGIAIALAFANAISRKDEPKKHAEMTEPKQETAAQAQKKTLDPNTAFCVDFLKKNVVVPMKNDNLNAIQVRKLVLKN